MRTKELFTFMRGREIAIIGKNYSKRAMIVLDHNYLHHEMDLAKKPYNIYRSLAFLKDNEETKKTFIIVSKATGWKRKKLMKSFFKYYTDYVDSYDFGFDFDPLTNMHNLFREVRMFFDFLMKEKITFYVKWSGKGFHFIIPNYLIKKQFQSVKEQLDFIRDFYQVLIKRFKLKTLDPAVCDHARLWKLENTIDWKTKTVARILDKKMFDQITMKFDLEPVSIKYSEEPLNMVIFNELKEFNLKEIKSRLESEIIAEVHT